MVSAGWLRGGVGRGRSRPTVEPAAGGTIATVTLILPLVVTSPRLRLVMDWTSLSVGLSLQVTRLVEISIAATSVCLSGCLLRPLRLG